MEDRLTKQEVLHVATLGRLVLNDDEIEVYSYKLKKILDEIEKILEVEVDEKDVMISPVEYQTKLSKNSTKTIDNKDAIKNAPHSFDDFIEVKGVFEQ